jgi:hypothetical protein
MDFRALRDMTDYVATAVRRLDRSQAGTPPAAGGFSLVEHVWHLADLEREGYGVRIARLLGEQEPALADFDGDRIARERAYATLDLERGLAAFEAARRENLARLATVGPDGWDRSGTQEGVGPVRLGDIPRMMAEHDAAHRQEIEALLAALA